MGILRFFHTSLRCPSINTSAIAILRKKTGYTLANIRKALELNENDIDKAEKWLTEQAKALGWSKAAKLQDRKATQGLVGIAVQSKKLAMVEVNCESDFVSRNEKFKSLVELVARTCLQQTVLTSGLDSHKVEFNAAEIAQFRANGVTLADHTAILIDAVGENTALKRAFCYETSREDIKIAVAVHPPANNSDILLGKYGTFISYQVNSENSDSNNISQIANNICTHIIGTNPVKLGEFGKDEPSEDGNDEAVLIHQDFLLNDAVTVGQLLTDSGITILDFKRFQCGELAEKEECDAEFSRAKI